MEGYIRNKSPLWRHALKRSVGPNEKISLDELYKNYGVKHDIPEGKPFVDWIREIKLRDRDVWEVMYKETNTNIEISPSDSQSKVIEKENKPVAPFVKTELTADELVELSVRNLKGQLDKITDLKILKYALSKASQLQDKDTVCKMLRKRIQMLELSRRV